MDSSEKVTSVHLELMSSLELKMIVLGWLSHLLLYTSTTRKVKHHSVFVKARTKCCSSSLLFSFYFGFLKFVTSRPIFHVDLQGKLKTISKFDVNCEICGKLFQNSLFWGPALCNGSFEAALFFPSSSRFGLKFWKRFRIFPWQQASRRDFRHANTILTVFNPGYNFAVYQMSNW